MLSDEVLNVACKHKLHVHTQTKHPVRPEQALRLVELGLKESSYGDCCSRWLFVS